MVYTMGTGASSNSLQSVASGSAPFNQQVTWSAGATGSRYTITANITYPITGGTSSFSTTEGVSTSQFSFDSALYSNFTGQHYLDIPFANSLSPGPYWVAYGNSNTSSSQAAGNMTQTALTASLQWYAGSNAVIIPLGVAANTTHGQYLGVGQFSTNAIGTTASLDLTNISRIANQPLPSFELIRQV
jgi:hypothetical protein